MADGVEGPRLHKRGFGSAEDGEGPHRMSDAVSDFTTFTVMAHSGRDRLIAVSV